MTVTGAATAARPTNPAAGADASESRIDKDSHFNGLYESKQNLRIEGLAEGEIQCEGTLTVAEGARVKAKVTASTITIAGELDGEVLCHGVFQIMPSGQVSASVSARRLIVQEGGLYNGEFRMITDPVTSLKPDRTPNTSAKSGKDDPSPALDTLKSDEWWRKFQAGEPLEAESGENEEHPPKGGKTKN
jgi:cytoskeletal protein CcmA (bactofilin family)